VHTAPSNLTLSRESLTIIGSNIAGLLESGGNFLSIASGGGIEQPIAYAACRIYPDDIGCSDTKLTQLLANAAGKSINVCKSIGGSESGPLPTTPGHIALCSLG